MQLYFLFFCVFQPFFLEVVEKSLITSESQIFFSKFCVNCVLMYHFEDCIESALKDVSGAHRWTCLLVDLRVPKICFWPAKFRKNVEFFEVRTCHWPGAQIWFTHKWKKLVTASVLLFVLKSVIASVIGMSFFSAVFQKLDRSFLVLHFDGNVCNWIPGVIWPRMVWFLGFLLGNGFLRWLHICTDWNLHELLSYFMFLTTSNFFDI